MGKLTIFGLRTVSTEVAHLFAIPAGDRIHIPRLVAFLSDMAFLAAIIASTIASLRTILGEMPS